jgi:predicted nucleic acid-binding protein
VNRFVFDSYAVLALHRNEPAGGRVRQLFRSRADRFLMSVVNLGEVYYRTAQEHDARTAERVIRWMERLSISYRPVSERLALDAARIKAHYARISYANCMAAALSRQEDARIVTGDREFLKLEQDGLIDLVWLG